ncbi:Dynein light chain Tctex-type protein 2B, partial [Acropora cervicornis]
MPEDLSNSYKIRPNFKQKFRPVAVKAIIHDVLHEELSGKQYNSEEATSWSKHISDTVKEKLKVQVVIGEQRGEGVKVACRCLWDSDTDNYAQDIFMN